MTFVAPIVTYVLILVSGMLPGLVTTISSVVLGLAINSILPQ